MKRGPVIRFAALAFVVLLVVAMFVGCAKYDGDQAEFCRLLPKATSFQTLAAEASKGSATEAARTMRDAAENFRSLEQSAPRSIRSEVASLGDSAERIARRIEDQKAAVPGTYVFEDASGTQHIVPAQPVPSDVRIGIFYDEFSAHPGTARAASDLFDYARDDCGLHDLDSSLSLNGYAYGGGVGVFGGPGSGSDGQPQTPGPTVGTTPGATLAPPVTAAPIHPTPEVVPGG